MWEETRREEGGPGTQGPSVPVLVPSLLTVGCGEGHRTILFVSCPLGKAESSAPCFMTLPSSRKAAGEFSSSEAEPSCISCSGSLEAGLVHLCYLLAVGLRWTSQPLGLPSPQLSSKNSKYCDLPPLEGWWEDPELSRMGKNFQDALLWTAGKISGLKWRYWSPSYSSHHLFTLSLASDPPTICRLCGVRVEGSWWPQNRAHIKSQDNQTYRLSLWLQTPLPSSHDLQTTSFLQGAGLWSRPG